MDALNVPHLLINELSVVRAFTNDKLSGLMKTLQIWRLYSDRTVF